MSVNMSYIMQVIGIYWENLKLMICAAHGQDIQRKKCHFHNSVVIADFQPAELTSSFMHSIPPTSPSTVWKVSSH